LAQSDAAVGSPMQLERAVCVHSCRARIDSKSFAALHDKSKYGVSNYTSV